MNKIELTIKVIVKIIEYLIIFIVLQQFNFISFHQYKLFSPNSSSLILFLICITFER